jgi:putative lipoprotein (rSAM/lipoprotein system)
MVIFGYVKNLSSNNYLPNPMVPIKLKFLNSYNSFIFFILSFIGFTTSCKKEDLVLMYGVPSASFRISGEVKSAVDGKVIPEIIVEVRESAKTQGGKDTTGMLIGTGFTYSTGEYGTQVGGFPAESTFHVKFLDTNGPLYGEYETLDTIIVFKDPKFTGGDGSWFKGVAEQELNVKLKPKK